MDDVVVVVVVVVVPTVVAVPKLVGLPAMMFPPAKPGFGFLFREMDGVVGVAAAANKYGSMALAVLPWTLLTMRPGLVERVDDVGGSSPAPPPVHMVVVDQNMAS